jgi:elongation of very long chain fatty acids protein 6
MSESENLPDRYLDHHLAGSWMAENYAIPIGMIVAYGIHMLVLGKIMETQEKPPKWVKPLKAVWDIFLSVMSGLGSLQLVPLLIASLQTKGFAGEVCTSTLQFEEPVLYLFMWSKFFELFDTTLILLSKKKLIFLHWYHHMATLMYCWDAFILSNPSGGVFAGMNLCVHTIMYAYYAATYFGRLPNGLRVVITSLQLLQMLVGVAAVITHLQCENAERAVLVNSQWALAMYISYFVLFAKLFYDSYMFKPSYSKPKSA